MSFADKTLTCRDCGQSFIFTAGEQEFFEQRGFQNEPSRCPDCRAERRSGGGGGDRMRGPRQMVDVTCSSCGKPTQVPFTPTAGRPVYCPDCYAAQRPSRSSYR